MAPLTTSIGNCPPGYTKCGSSPENVFCTKQTKCPINSINVASIVSTTGCTTASKCAVLMSNTGNYKAVTYSRGHTTDMAPSSQFTINEYAMCELKVTDNITPGRPQFALNLDKDTTCNTAGNVKWKLTDSTTEDRVFAANGLTAYITSLNAYPNAKRGMTGYHQTGKSGKDYTWGLYTRSYVPWHINCRDEMHNLMDKNTFAEKLKTAQLAVVVTGSISGFILGIVLATLEIIILKGADLPYIPGKGEGKRIKLRKIKTVMNYLFKFIQAPFQIWSIVLGGSAKHLLATTADKKCSDEETNASLAYLADNLHSTHTSTLTALCLLIMSVLIDFILSAWHKRAAKNETPTTPKNGSQKQDKARINEGHSMVDEETFPGAMQTKSSDTSNPLPPPP